MPIKIPARPTALYLKQMCGLIGLGAALSMSNLAFAACTYTVDNQWNTGFVANITIKNDTAAAVNNWSVNWSYSANRITSSWNSNLSGSNPYTATNIGWNGSIAPGQSVSFGVQGNKNGSSAERPTINGTLCSSISVSSARSSGVSSSSLSSSSLARSSAVSSFISSFSGVSSLSRSSVPSAHKFVGNIMEVALDDIDPNAAQPRTL